MRINNLSKIGGYAIYINIDYVFDLLILFSLQILNSDNFYIYIKYNAKCFD